MAVYLGRPVDCTFSETDDGDPQVVLWAGP
jgi:hypothetical protein